MEDATGGPGQVDELMERLAEDLFYCSRNWITMGSAQTSYRWAFWFGPWGDSGTELSVSESATLENDYLFDFRNSRTCWLSYKPPLGSSFLLPFKNKGSIQPTILGLDFPVYSAEISAEPHWDLDIQPEARRFTRDSCSSIPNWVQKHKWRTNEMSYHLHHDRDILPSSNIYIYVHHIDSSWWVRIHDIKKTHKEISHQL